MSESYHFENWGPAVRRFGFMIVGVLIGITLTRIFPQKPLMGIVVPVLVMLAVGIVVIILALTIREPQKKET